MRAASYIYSRIMLVKDLAKLKSDTTVSSGYDEDLEARY